jgi:hypothetical protein
MKGYRLSMKVLAAAALALAFAAPAAAAPHLTAADRASINRTLDVFVNHAVKRVDVGASFDSVAPELRPGMSRKAWAKGDIPVYPFPAQGQTFHGWNILYVTRQEVGLELELLPRAHSKVGPIIFHVYLRPVHGRWLVDSFMPVATLAPLGAKHTKVRSVRDYSPRRQAAFRLGTPAARASSTASTWSGPSSWSPWGCSASPAGASSRCSATGSSAARGGGGSYRRFPATPPAAVALSMASWRSSSAGSRTASRRSSTRP